MAFATWDPFREMEQLRREINRALESFDLDRWSFPFSRFSFLPGRAAHAYPLLNMSEDADHLYIEALAPGLEPDSLKVTVVHDQLTISGEKHPLSKEGEIEAWHRNERAAGNFTRTIKLPVDIDADNIKADYKYGVLAITMTKAETAKPRQITVSLC